MKLSLLLSLLIVFVACTEPNHFTLDASYGNTSLELKCSSPELLGDTKVAILRANGAFDVKATLSSIIILDVVGQRPSLNVRIEDGPRDVVNEFVDFNDKGLEIVPVDGPKKFEISLGSNPHQLTYTDERTKLNLMCQFNSHTLVTFLGIAPKAHVIFTDVKAVGFDIDDTLMATSSTFVRGFATGGLPTPDNVLFFTHVNACDAGCAESTITLPDGTTKVLPANAPSTPKAKAIELIKYHKSMGHKIYAITARPDINGDFLRKYLASQMGIDPQHVFFEPEIDYPGNPAGKTDRIESLNLDVYYGDSDSDITETLKAFVDASGKRTKKIEPVRFLRSPKSTNRKAGRLNKYHPGYFGEPIIEGSY